MINRLARGRSAGRRNRSLLLTIGLVIAAGVATIVRAADPSALWHIVHDQCVPDVEKSGAPTPCASVDLAGGYAILKGTVGATQFLLIPTARVSGIEDPAILASDAPNYWQDAWAARHFMEERAGHPMERDTLSLAINSAYGRTQDQLHIHIDCIRADVRAALRAGEATIGPHWSEFARPLGGYHYRAMRIDQENLAGVDPFRLLAEDVKPDEMGRHTLVLVGMRFSDTGPGFALLDDHLDLAAGDRASGETLQDHECLLAR